ncbi:aldo/keto reductase [Klebsiella pneumoniae]|nr:aldo/keto reductase [Klebsiella pneumoniae]HBW8037133.1 aldo/keto reductase [Klebsiella pneumoniae]HBY8865525.1 aldo/keto reductase [Klebsiella pneumoniae]
MVNLHFPYKFRESESLKSFLANEVKEGKNADKKVNQYKSKFFAK